MKPRIKVKAKTRPHLTVVPFTPAEPDNNVSVKDAIDELSRRHEAGEVESIAIVAIGDNGNTVWRRISGGWRITMAGALVEAQMRCFDDFED